MVELERSFDTLAASRKLRGTGMPKRQAEATAEVVADAVKGLVTCEVSRLATGKYGSAHERSL